jgi:hypothetical protein
MNKALKTSVTGITGVTGDFREFLDLNAAPGRRGGCRALSPYLLRFLAKTIISSTRRCPVHFQEYLKIAGDTGDSGDAAHNPRSWNNLSVTGFHQRPFLVPVTPVTWQGVHSTPDLAITSVVMGRRVKEASATRNDAAQGMHSAQTTYSVLKRQADTGAERNARAWRISFRGINGRQAYQP